MNSDDNTERIVILPYKDAVRNNLIDTEDMVKWLEDEGIKEDLDDCLNNLMTSK